MPISIASVMDEERQGREAASPTETSSSTSPQFLETVDGEPLELSSARGLCRRYKCPILALSLCFILHAAYADDTNAQFLLFRRYLYCTRSVVALGSTM